MITDTLDRRIELYNASVYDDTKALYDMYKDNDPELASKSTWESRNKYLHRKKVCRLLFIKKNYMREGIKEFHFQYYQEFNVEQKVKHEIFLFLSRIGLAKSKKSTNRVKERVRMAMLNMPYIDGITFIMKYGDIIHDSYSCTPFDDDYQFSRNVLMPKLLNALKEMGVYNSDQVNGS